MLFWVNIWFHILPGVLWGLMVGILHRPELRPWLTFDALQGQGRGGAVDKTFSVHFPEHLLHLRRLPQGKYGVCCKTNAPMECEVSTCATRVLGCIAIPVRITPIPPYSLLLGPPPRWHHCDFCRTGRRRIVSENLRPATGVRMRGGRNRGIFVGPNRYFPVAVHYTVRPPSDMALSTLPWNHGAFYCVLAALCKIMYRRTWHALPTTQLKPAQKPPPSSRHVCLP